MKLARSREVGTGAHHYWPWTPCGINRNHAAMPFLADKSNIKGEKVGDQIDITTR
jgi:hypothetical protein